MGETRRDCRVCLQTAVAKLSEAERAKEEMENELRRKEQELQKRSAARFPGRLAAGAGQDLIMMGVSHRGLGAFPRAEMIRTPPRKVSDETPKCLASEEQVPTGQDLSSSNKSASGAQQVEAVELERPSAVAGGWTGVDADCTACPMNVNTPAAAASDVVSRVDERLVADDDDRPADKLTAGECKPPTPSENDEQQQQQQPASETDVNEYHLTAST